MVILDKVTALLSTTSGTVFSPWPSRRQRRPRSETAGRCLRLLSSLPPNSSSLARCNEFSWPLFSDQFVSVLLGVELFSACSLRLAALAELVKLGPLLCGNILHGGVGKCNTSPSCHLNAKSELDQAMYRASFFHMPHAVFPTSRASIGLRPCLGLSTELSVYKARLLVSSTIVARQVPSPPSHLTTDSPDLQHGCFTSASCSCVLQGQIALAATSSSIAGPTQVHMAPSRR